MAKKSNEVTGWVGWVGFASFMLLLGGVFALLEGFVALFKETAVYHAPTNSLYVLDYNQWGWAHMLIGVLAIVAAGSLMAGHMYGRIVAVLVALVAAFANMAFVPVYPVWSVIMITISFLVIWAVTVHGDELRDE